MENNKEQNLIMKREENILEQEKSAKEKLFADTKRVNKKAKEFAKKYNAKTNDVEE